MYGVCVYRSRVVVLVGFYSYELCIIIYVLFVIFLFFLDGSILFFFVFCFGYNV